MNEKRIFVNGKYASPFTEEQKKEIYTMFFGPYKDEWKNKNGIVDNSDTAIGKRLGFEAYLISSYTTKICKDHFEKIAKLHRLKFNK